MRPANYSLRPIIPRRSRLLRPAFVESEVGGIYFQVLRNHCRRGSLRKLRSASADAPVLAPRSSRANCRSAIAAQRNGGMAMRRERCGHVRTLQCELAYVYF